MNEPTNTQPPERGNKALTILRIFLWLMPAIFLPISVVIAGSFFNLFYGNNGDAALALCILAVVIATTAVGYFDQRIALMQKRIAPPHSKRELARWTAIFVVLQVIIAPTVCFAVLYGFCMVTESGFF